MPTKPDVKPTPSSPAVDPGIAPAPPVPPAAQPDIGIAVKPELPPVVEAEKQG
ncbi:MAG: hypothetical protein IPL96_17530 [Holophagaceae bacterium]|nr:hypothetical protein [Holophagaceae bacterium]